MSSLHYTFLEVYLVGVFVVWALISLSTIIYKLKRKHKYLNLIILSILFFLISIFWPFIILIMGFGLLISIIMREYKTFYTLLKNEIVKILRDKEV